MGVMNLMSAFGMKLSGLIKLKPGHGAVIEGNDFVLDALEMLPPPRIQGRLTAISVGAGVITQTFGPAPGQDVQALRAPVAGSPNYMYFRHGALRFGKLTMADADLLILDDNPANAFDFSLDRYNDQLVAGYSRSTAALGLVVHMPDFRTLGRSDSASVRLRPVSRVHTR
jgi:hypothetical protein